MATKKISQLTAATDVAAADLVPIVDDPSGTAVTKRATWTLVRDYILGISGGVSTEAEDKVFTADIAQGAAQGAAGNKTSIVVRVTGMTNAAATTVATVTVPNGNHSAGIFLRGVAWLGAGGAVAAHEGAVAFERTAVVTRTTGVALNNASTDVIGQPTSQQSVTGGASITVALGFGATSGAAGATQTFTLTIAVTRGSGSSTNHGCELYITLLNAENSGITIA